MDRAPGINVLEYHTQSKKERERELRQLRRNGGVCLTSYGVIVNNAQQLATDVNGRDFVWVTSSVCSWNTFDVEHVARFVELC